MTSTLSTDYLVIGAGATGMAFADALLDVSDADIVLVDRQEGPGGHWRHGYGFLRLHLPSSAYGVDSTHLGQDRILSHSIDAGMYERASAMEIAAYYQQVLDHRLLASGRVRFLARHDYLGDGVVRSLVSGQQTKISVRAKTVDATRLANRIPALTPPPFLVADDARCIPVNGLTTAGEMPGDVVVIGGGKTAMDAVTWLREVGMPQERIRWVRPRESWLLNRAAFQPLTGALASIAGTTAVLEAAAVAENVDELYAHAERGCAFVRIDPQATPTMCHGASMSQAEAALLGSVEAVIRHQHVHRVERDRIVLDDGSELAASPTTLHVHAATRGLNDASAVPVFTADTITIGLLSRGNSSVSAAAIARIEVSDRDLVEANRLTPANPGLDTPLDYLRMFLMGMTAEGMWRNEPDLGPWLAASRLNVTRLAEQHSSPQDLAAVRTRFRAAVGPGLARLRSLTAGMQDK